MEVKWTEGAKEDLRKLCHPGWRAFRFTIKIPREIKWFFQRVFRGYGDDELWNVNYYLGKKIVKYLKAFKKMDRIGYNPYFCDFNEDHEITNEKEAMAKWEKTLDDMIEGFEFLHNAQERLSDYKTSEDYNKACKEAEKKAMLFVAHFNSLWD